MGTSYRLSAVAAIFCLGILQSPAAFANGESWLERLGSVTVSLIPEIKLAAYLGFRRAADDVQAASKTEHENGPVDEHWQLDGQWEEAPSKRSFTYALTNPATENLGSSAGIHLLSTDPNSHSKVSGLARSALAGKRLPTYGLDLAYNFAPRWSLGMRGHFLDVATSELTSSESVYSATVEYAARDEMRVGFGYEQFAMRVDAELMNFPGYVAMKYSGPRFYTTFQF